TATVRAKALAIIRTTPRPRPTAKAMVKATGTPTARAKANARATATAIPATETATPTDTRSRSRYQGGASTREPLPGALSLSRALLTPRSGARRPSRLRAALVRVGGVSSRNRVVRKACRGVAQGSRSNASHFSGRAGDEGP